MSAVFGRRLSLLTYPFNEMLSRMPRRFPPHHQKTLPPLQVLTVVRHPIRWKLLQLLIDGTELSATEAASMLNQDVDLMIRHFSILRRAKILDCRYHEQDRRFLMYSLRKDLSPEPGVLDFGFCTLYLSGDRSKELRIAES